MQDRSNREKGKNAIKFQDDRIKHYCKQNQAKSSMLYEMIQVGMRHNGSHHEPSAKSSSEFYKLLTRFNQVLNMEVKAMEEDTVQERQAVEQIIKFMRSPQFEEGNSQQISEKEAIPYFLNVLQEKENSIAYLESSIAKMEQGDKQAQYEADLQRKNNEMKMMILQKEQKIVKLKNRFEKMADENRKSEKKYLELKKRMIADEIKLREIEVSQNRVGRK